MKLYGTDSALSDLTGGWNVVKVRAKTARIRVSEQSLSLLAPHFQPSRHVRWVLGSIPSFDWVVGNVVGFTP